jgi:hypothetical protein
MRIAMMAITTSSSIRVKIFRDGKFLPAGESMTNPNERVPMVFSVLCVAEMESSTLGIPARGLRPQRPRMTVVLKFQTGKTADLADGHYTETCLPGTPISRLANFKAELVLGAPRLCRPRPGQNIQFST